MTIVGDDAVVSGGISIHILHTKDDLRGEVVTADHAHFNPHPSYEG